ncbi:MAG: hypothetical protein HZB76_01525 [Chlamydiae bacterium]|nr:hypothetical protein [Chlamydiota bacterium]
MSEINLNTCAENTWCPGCGNFAILTAFKAVLKSLAEEGVPIENIVLVSGIGCHGKIVDYINGVYGLTTGQCTPTSPQGYKGRSTPKGSLEYPLNPLEMMLSCGATYLARGTSHGMPLLKQLFKEAILHKGFALIDVLQVCFVYYNMYEYYAKRVYELKDYDMADFSAAHNKIREWDYNQDGKIALGTFYKTTKESFDEYFKIKHERMDRGLKISQILNRDMQ